MLRIRTSLFLEVINCHLSSASRRLVLTPSCESLYSAFLRPPPGSDVFQTSFHRRCLRAASVSPRLFSLFTSTPKCSRILQQEWCIFYSHRKHTVGRYTILLIFCCSDASQDSSLLSVDANILYSLLNGRLSLVRKHDTCEGQCYNDEDCLGFYCKCGIPDGGTEGVSRVSILRRILYWHPNYSRIDVLFFRRAINQTWDFQDISWDFFFLQQYCILCATIYNAKLFHVWKRLPQAFPICDPCSIPLSADLLFRWSRYQHDAFNIKIFWDDYASCQCDLYNLHAREMV